MFDAVSPELRGLNNQIAANMTLRRSLFVLCQPNLVTSLLENSFS